MGKAVRRPFAAHRSALGALPEFWLRLGGYHQKHEPAPRTRVPPELQGFCPCPCPIPPTAAPKSEFDPSPHRHVQTHRAQSCSDRCHAGLVGSPNGHEVFLKCKWRQEAFVMIGHFGLSDSGCQLPWDLLRRTQAPAAARNFLLEPFLDELALIRSAAAEHFRCLVSRQRSVHGELQPQNVLGASRLSSSAPRTALHLCASQARHVGGRPWQQG